MELTTAQALSLLRFMVFLMKQESFALKTIDIPLFKCQVVRLLFSQKHKEER